MSTNEELARDAAYDVRKRTFTQIGNHAFARDLNYEETISIILAALNEATAAQAQQFHDEIAERQKAAFANKELDIKERDRLRAEITTLASGDRLPPDASNNALIVQECMDKLRAENARLREERASIYNDLLKIRTSLHYAAWGKAKHEINEIISVL